jgi:hypothetical protein
LDQGNREEVELKDPVKEINDRVRTVRYDEIFERLLKGSSDELIAARKAAPLNSDYGPGTVEDDETSTSHTTPPDPSSSSHGDATPLSPPLSPVGKLICLSLLDKLSQCIRRPASYSEPGWD